MASGSAGEGAGSNTDKKTSKVVMLTPPVSTSVVTRPETQGWIRDKGCVYLSME